MAVLAVFFVIPNLNFVQDRPAQRVAGENLLPATQCYVVRRDI
jgi:hypothetical protein